MSTSHIRPAVYLTESVDPSPHGEITGIIAYLDTDNTLNLTIYGQEYPSIIFDADDIVALTNLLNQGAEPMNTRDSCTQALELLDNIDDLLESIFPTPEYHNQGQKAEAKLTAARDLIYTRLAAIEDGLAAQFPIPNHKLPIPAPSTSNATLPEQEDAPS